ncbi:uncharacterized protein LOC129802014 [Phlebotomus papatasi]|uniref:uncharacterized protein LOC129802014 n=1 Tax=Phlebotomus papatasi TaxID=29031 RepID=UPI002483A6C3|nr:uncharacterized protein LOC129802014 [Phlebotomus papatasi]
MDNNFDPRYLSILAETIRQQQFQPQQNQFMMPDQFQQQQFQPQQNFSPQQFPPHNQQQQQHQQQQQGQQHHQQHQQYPQQQAQQREQSPGQTTRVRNDTQVKNKQNDEPPQQIKNQQQSQQKIQRPQQTFVVHTLLGAREIELLIREFNPAKNSDLYATEWISEIEQLGTIHKWDSCHLLLYATMRLSGVAKTWFEYSLESISDWEDFKQGLVSNFPRAIDASDVHAKLIAKKRRSQSLEEYFHSTVKLAKRIKLDDDAIKDYLIRGLEQPKHQIVLSSIGPCTLSEFLQHMQRLDADSTPTSTNTKRNRSPDGSTDDRHKVRRSYSPERSERKERSRKCAICSSGSHWTTHCPDHPKKLKKSSRYDEGKGSRSDSSSRSNVDKSPSNNSETAPKQIMCFKCKTRGHIAKNCPEKDVNSRKRDMKSKESASPDLTQEDCNEFDIVIDDEMDEQIDEVLDLANM